MKKILAIGALFFLLTGFGLVFAQDDISKHRPFLNGETARLVIVDGRPDQIDA